MMRLILKCGIWSLLAVLFLAGNTFAVTITDDAGQKLDFPAPPAKVVSLLPSATEIICAVGAGETLAGVTYHDTHLPCLVGLPVVGGAFTPQFPIINGLEPDLLIVAPRDFEKAKTGRGTKTYPILVWNDGGSLAEAEIHLAWLADVFQKRAEAEKVIAASRDLMATIARKTTQIPDGKKQRVMRLLYTPTGLLTPGEDSFQTEMIKAAGGLTPALGTGSFVPVSLEAWQKFNPEVVIDCGSDKAALREYLERGGWNEALAVKNKRIYNFPCALTCRAAANTGYFVAWLSSMIYAAEFADPSNLAHPQEIMSERTIPLNLPYVEKVRIIDSRIMDFVHRTLLIDFKTPQTVVSSDEGERGAIHTVGNSFSPTPTWSIYHQYGYERSRDDLFKALRLDPSQAELIFTGADMNNLVIRTASFKDITVYALVTAGVEGNALRSSRDAGNWYEPGTINIIVLTNHQLSPQAAARALITITEAKTAALWDMDIRSVQSPLSNPATGTGTDSIIVVSGEGPVLSASGGHTKLGELMAEAVHGAVQEALVKQNGKGAVRNVFERLAERGLSPYGLMGGPDCPCIGGNDNYQSEFEALLLSPRYAGFLQAAFSLSDAQVMGQLTDMASFEAWALTTASEIAGRPVTEIENIIGRDDLPPVLKIALNSLGTGLKYRPFSQDSGKGTGQ
ncbi:adenosylcobinamide amidohydrolase [Deltaproteobacteria bacterium OttesenSCG-928-M10]|nr:adenosylcobinamide amidohydrolase [Deltaproteobacteria bacterium OttesenSCG-928-M10]